MGAPKSLQNFTLPRLNPNDDFALIAEVYVADGAKVSVGDSILDACTTKINFTFSAEQAGYVVLHVTAQDRVPVGQNLYSLFATEEAALSASQQKTSQSAELQSLTARYSQAARAWIEDHPEARAKGGVITARQLRAARQELVAPNKAFEIAAIAASASAGFASTLSTTFSGSQLFAAHGGFGPLAVVIEETAKLLTDAPKFTAYFANGRCHYYDRVDVGLVIDANGESHLLTLDRANALAAPQIIEKITDYVLKLERQQLTGDDVRPSTFTVTDLSSEKILNFQPLLNGQQSAILGLGGDASAPGQPLVLNLTFDHRVLSGREAAHFLKTLRAALEARA